MLRWLLPATLALVVFLAGFILDTAGLIRLFWASVTGYFGMPARIGAVAAALVCAAPLLRVAYRHVATPAPAPRASRQRPPRRAAAKPGARTEIPSGGMASPGPGKRPRRAAVPEDAGAAGPPPSRGRKAQRPTNAPDPGEAKQPRQRPGRRPE
ncbi:MAG TPA: hypothetical protein PLD10_12835 [Rhodopila sp.]|nr:hypothetical protein [Rhodopila sp.]